MTIIVTNDTHRVHAASSNKDATEFDAVFLENWQPIYRVLMRLVGDHAEAEDLALETFWRLYQRPPANDRGLGGWLYRVATNLGLNALRARKRRQQHELDAAKWAIENNVSDPAQDVAAEEERAQVRTILGEMDERQARLLILRHSGMAYKELADTLGVSVNSVGTLLVRAEREFEKKWRETRGG
ncbi:MAG: sigma-70 family RNA polymerase sigma factor [Chloroflexi bacterium]|nr:sigma-70 family RNA polymerase sigma factor [Chloroflexota bacterium]